MNLQNDGKDLTDDELVAFAKSGLDTAYVELCARHKKMAFSVIHRITKNWEDSEDALQDSLLKVHMHLGGFDGRSKFSTWFTRIAINTALMSIRRKKAHPTESLDDLTTHDGLEYRSFACPSPSPESQVAAMQMSFQLKQAIDRLPPSLRDVTTIRQSEDVSVAEVAAIAGISLAAAKSRLLRGRAKLSATIQGSGRGGRAFLTSISTLTPERRYRLKLNAGPLKGHHRGKIGWQGSTDYGR
ncbi:MAG TPA: sigma-70 family RNA polymerase sigma factor [Acidisarcina sp.]